MVSAKTWVVSSTEARAHWYAVPGREKSSVVRCLVLLVISMCVLHVYFHVVYLEEGDVAEGAYLA